MKERTILPNGRRSLEQHNAQEGTEHRAPVTINAIETAALANAHRWQSVPCDLPACQGLAIRALIDELKLPKVSAVMWAADLAPIDLIGVEANYSNGRCRLFALDLGSTIVPIVSDFWPEVSP